MLKTKFSIINRDKGTILVLTVVMMFIFSLVILGLLSYATAQIRVNRSTVYRQQAFDIAEAGANYYEWHLANFSSDFWDGNASTTPGPYVHNYVDATNGQTIGSFSLSITPPPVGSTVVTVQSAGHTLADPQDIRTVTVRYGIPSLAQYAFLTNGDIWIGSNETVSGPFFSNGGVRFDGSGNAPIMSAMSSYTCPSWSGSPCPATENGIWGAAATSTKNFWQYPQPNQDFSAITANLATMKSAAQSKGIYLAPSNADGYSLVFNTSSTVSIYKITSLQNDPTGQDVNNVNQNASLDYKNRTLLATDALPANGIIYVEDNTWVEGTVAGQVMVAAAVLPYNSASAPSIIIPNNIVYATKNGSDSLGLLGQQNILISYLSPNNLEIDAALIAQNGSAERYYWANNILNSITIYGTTASFGTWTWSWVNASNQTVSGYSNTDTIYDSNLLYAPPPSFPLSSAGYQQISWSSN